MKRKLAYFFAALLLSGVATLGVGCSPACKGLYTAFTNTCLGDHASDNACQQIINQLIAHGCIDGPPQ